MVTQSTYGILPDRQHSTATTELDSIDPHDNLLAQSSKDSPAEAGARAAKGPGWWTAKCVAALLAIVVVINASFLIWAISTSGARSEFGTLQKGSCQETARLGTWLHLAINILGTAMLSGSNYCTWHASASASERDPVVDTDPSTLTSILPSSSYSYGRYAASLHTHAN